MTSVKDNSNPPHSPKEEVMGQVISVNISTQKGRKKQPVKTAHIGPKGIDGDVHSGDWHRQISLLAVESIEKMNTILVDSGKNVSLGPGDFAENITTRGIDFSQLDIGERLQIGEALIEITQKGKECHLDCEIKRLVGDCIMPREGVFARVINPGNVAPGDRINLSRKPHQHLLHQPSSP